MKFFGVVFVLVCSLAACTSSSKVADEFPPLPPDIIYGTPPDQSVKSWVRLNILGDMDHPFWILWISPEKFERQYHDFLLVLPQDDYTSVTKFIRLNKCAVSENKTPGRGTIQVTEYHEEKTTTLCIMPQLQACNYLTRVLAIPEIIWTDEKAEPFRGLRREIVCEAQTK